MGILLISACRPKDRSTSQTGLPTNTAKEQVTFEFDLQGHRGARGLAPENSLPAFKKALELGVNTLELDVVVTKDKQLLVSHEPWMNPEICLDAKGDSIPKTKARQLNIYQMDYEETQGFDCGSMGNPNFLEQEKYKVTKPLLKEVIAYAEDYGVQSQQQVNYNIEIKSLPRGDGIYHPEPAEFSELLMKLLKEKLPQERVVVQSFDFRVLHYLHQNYPDQRLAALVYEDDATTNLEKLGFSPAIYSPYHKLVSEDMVKSLHEKNIAVIPWTVNDTLAMKDLLLMGVDGLITDYPNLALRFKK